MKEIKKVKIKKNVRNYNEHHNCSYENEEGVVFIEYEDGTKSILDLKSCNDLSNCDFVEILDTKDTQEEIIFNNIIFERVDKVKGK